MGRACGTCGGRESLMQDVGEETGEKETTCKTLE
jgi:hypothetical protein